MEKELLTSSLIRASMPKKKTSQKKSRMRFWLEDRLKRGFKREEGLTRKLFNKQRRGGVLNISRRRRMRCSLHSQNKEDKKI